MSELLSQWTNLIWFIGVPIIFIAIVWWVMRPKEKKHWEQDAKIPFEDEQKRQDDDSKDP